MKRFWTGATVAPAPEGYGIALDGRPLRLPGGGVLRLRSAALAAAIAAEWQGATGDEIKPDDLPLTGLAGAALERIPAQRPGIVEALHAYAKSDLLCYRATDPDLAERQHESWQPWLGWAAGTLSALLVVTDSLLAVDQPVASLLGLRAAIEACDDYALAGLGVITPATGSLVLGLAVIAGTLPADEAFRIASLEESFQAARWGEDEEAAQRRRRIAAEIATAADFVRLSRS